MWAEADSITDMRRSDTCGSIRIPVQENAIISAIKRSPYLSQAALKVKIRLEADCLQNSDYIKAGIYIRLVVCDFISFDMVLLKEEIHSLHFTDEKHTI